jgi:tetratricopeptide (TPR) repeat protein
MNEQAHRLWLSAEAARDRGEWERARGDYLRALALDPRHVPSLLGVSTAHSQLGAHRDAHAAVLAACAAMPQHPALLYGLAQRLRYFNEYQALVECLSRPAFASGAPLLAVSKGAVMLSSIGAHSEARALADYALLRDPKHPASLYVRGNHHFFDGELEDAERCSEASMKQDPAFFQNSWMLASVRTQTRDSNHVPRLKRQLSSVRRGSEAEAYLGYGLYKELHDIGEYEQAWGALTRACSAKRKLVPYDAAADLAMATALRDVCTREFVQATSDPCPEVTPIFIVGMHRAGTTLLERMLAGHSRVADAGETYAFGAQMQLATDHATPMTIDAELVRRAATADFSEVARGYAGTARWLARGKPFVTEKLPINFWQVGFMAKALPNARFLHMQRDPMDTCFSNLRTLFAGVATYSYDQAELGNFYRLYRGMMAHWHEVLPGRVLDVSYDALVDDPQAMAARVAIHCGLDYQPGMVDVSRPSGTVATASAGVARQGIRRDRGQLWRAYEPHLQPLAQALAPLYR